MKVSRNLKFLSYLALSLFFFIISCAPTVVQEEKKEKMYLLRKKNEDDTVNTISLSKKEKNEYKIIKRETEPGRIIEYSIKPSKSRRHPSYPLKNGDISIHFDTISLGDLLKYLAYEVLGFSYIAPPDLKETLSIHVESISEREILNLLREILSVYGYNVVIDYKKRYLKVFKGKKVLFLYDTSVLVYEFKYISPSEVKDFLQSLGVKYSLVGKRKLLVFANKEDLEILKDYLTYIDNLFSNEKHIAFIKTSLDPRKVKSYVEKIMALLGLSSGIKLVESLDDVSMVVVVTNDKTLLNEIKKWIRIIENSRSSSQERIYILKLNYLKAEEVENFLQRLNIFEDIYLEGSPEGHLSSSTINKSDEILRENQGQNIKQNTKVEGLKHEAQLEGHRIISIHRNRKLSKSKIVADPSTNTLIIKATPLQYKVIESIIRKLDKQPSQAFIEMVVAEVSLGDSLNYGLEALFKGIIDSYRFSVETSFGLRQNSGALGGFKAIIFGKDMDIRGILNFLSSKTKLNVLSAPYILVKNGEEAKIEVGAEVPVITELMTTTSGGVPVVTTAVQYRSTGIILRVKPIISQDGSITLQIEEEVSDAIPNTLSPDVQSPIITKRSATTTLVLRDGQVALLGGILQKRYEENQKAIPFLGDIPGLGYLFKTKEERSSRTELLILLKVHIIRDFSEMEVHKYEVIENLENLKKLLKMLKRSNGKEVN